MIKNRRTTDNTSDCWKVLIIDDDNFVHVMIKEKMKNFTFEGKSLDIISAYTGSEALKILSNNKDVALILLDMYIGTETTGLILSKYIREIVGNEMVRIVMMTSAGNSSLQKDAMLNYDINGYEEKTELLTNKLDTVITSALRYYRDILHIINNRKAMEQIAASSTELFETNSLNEFLSSTFFYLNSIINSCCTDEVNDINGIAAVKSTEDGNFYITSGFGQYKNTINANIHNVLSFDDYNLIQNVHKNEDYIIVGDKYVSSYRSSSGTEAIILFDINKNKKYSVDFEILDIFHKNISTTFENLCINKEIEETQKEILYILGEVTEARSEETGNHVQRVSKYAKILAEKFGLSRKDRMLVTMAAPIHDIGKIAISDKILLKPGKLTPSEFEVVKRHTTIGYNILKGSNRDVLKSAAIIAHQHHEKYDGSGYPQGLKGEDIHIFGRIVAVADVFDALGSPRVYKKAWVMNDILNYFKEEKGKHFDPNLVDILFENLDEFIEIKEKFSDKNTKVDGQVSDNNNRK